MSFYRPFDPTQGCTPASYSMDDPQYRDFIKQEFYWLGKDMPNSHIIKLMRKYNANQLGVDERGFTTLKAPLLVAIQTTDDNECLLMLVRKVVNCGSIPCGIDFGLHDFGNEYHQAALISTFDLSLKAIPSPIPSMCFEPLANKKGIRSVQFHRVSPSRWFVPEVCHLTGTGEKGVVWTGIRQLLGLKKCGTDPSDIVHRIQWAEGHWDKHAPAEQLVYPFRSPSIANARNLCTKRHPPTVPLHTDAHRIQELEREGWIPSRNIFQPKEKPHSEEEEIEDIDASSSRPLPPPLPREPRRGRFLIKKPLDVRDASPSREEIVDLCSSDDEKEEATHRRDYYQEMRDDMASLIDAKFQEQARQFEEKQEKVFKLIASSIESNQAAILALGKRLSKRRSSTKKASRRPTTKHLK